LHQFSQLSKGQVQIYVINLHCLDILFLKTQRNNQIQVFFLPFPCCISPFLFPRCVLNLNYSLWGNQFTSMLNITSTWLWLWKPCTLRGGEWSFKNHGSRKTFAEFHGSCSLNFFLRLRKLFIFLLVERHLNILEPEHCELTFKTLWILGLTTEEIKMSRVQKEKR